MGSMLKPSNQLLAALPPKELELIRPDLVDLDLPVQSRGDFSGRVLSDDGGDLHADSHERWQTY